MFCIKLGRENYIIVVKLKCNNIKFVIDILNCVVKDLNMMLISFGKLMFE